jgi:hypothetical protein
LAYLKYLWYLLKEEKDLNPQEEVHLQDHLQAVDHWPDHQEEVVDHPWEACPEAQHQYLWQLLPLTYQEYRTAHLKEQCPPLSMVIMPKPTNSYENSVSIEL